MGDGSINDDDLRLVLRQLVVGSVYEGAVAARIDGQLITVDKRGDVPEGNGRGGTR